MNFINKTGVIHTSKIAVAISLRNDNCMVPF